METKLFFVVLILCGLSFATPHAVLEKLLEKRVATVNYDAYSNDINDCLFARWILDPPAVLSGPVECTGSERLGLCYGDSTSPAQFAVCYNTVNLIPEFSGHVVKSNPAMGGSGSAFPWRKEKGTNGAKKPPNQAEQDDYNQGQQITENPTWNTGKYYCAKGHLTPSADFATPDERKMTFIVTNAAPQWQQFNNCKWKALEYAVRDYAKKNGDVYVFTGTGGEATDSKGNVFKMNKEVVAPKWYWKAVCDPKAKQSIVFVAQNNVGDQDSKTDRGMISCYSLKDAANIYPGFKLPLFHDINCNPSSKGTFTDKFCK